MKSSETNSTLPDATAELERIEAVLFPPFLRKDYRLERADSLSRIPLSRTQVAKRLIALRHFEERAIRAWLQTYSKPHQLQQWLTAKHVEPFVKTLVRQRLAEISKSQIQKIPSILRKSSSSSLPVSRKHIP